MLYCCFLDFNEIFYHEIADTDRQQNNRNPVFAD